MGEVARIARLALLARNPPPPGGADLPLTSSGTLAAAGSGIGSTNLATVGNKSADSGTIACPTANLGAAKVKLWRGLIFSMLIMKASSPLKTCRFLYALVASAQLHLRQEVFRLGAPRSGDLNFGPVELVDCKHVPGAEELVLCCGNMDCEHLPSAEELALRLGNIDCEQLSSAEELALRLDSDCERFPGMKELHFPGAELLALRLGNIDGEHFPGAA